MATASSDNTHVDPYTQKNVDHDTPLKDKVADLVAFAEKSKFCMMTTHVADTGRLASRCMALAGKEGNGIDLIFHANSASGKTDDLTSSPETNLAFLSPSGDWASISGQASLIHDRDAIHKYYSPLLKAWMGDLGDGKHDGGPEDPRIVLIKVVAKTAQYAISKRTVVGEAYQIAKGVASGDVPDVNRIRQLSEAELDEWRKQGA